MTIVDLVLHQNKSLNNVSTVVESRNPQSYAWLTPKWHKRAIGNPCRPETRVAVCIASLKEVITSWQGDTVIMCLQSDTSRTKMVSVSVYKGRYRSVRYITDTHFRDAHNNTNNLRCNAFLWKHVHSNIELLLKHENTFLVI